MTTASASLSSQRPQADAAPAAPAARFADAALVGATGALAFAPIAILGPAIGWPASLRAPAARQLLAIDQAAAAVASGYGVYLLYSVLVLPAMLLIARRAFGTLGSVAAQLVVAFAALSVLARCIGILRWLTVMPHLAVGYRSADASTRSTIEWAFQATHAYGGGIGELLGVGLFMAAALAVAMVAALKRRSLPRWLAGSGLVVASMLGSMLLPSFGLAGQVPVAVGASALSVWMLAYAAYAAQVGLSRRPA